MYDKEKKMMIRQKYNILLFNIMFIFFLSNYTHNLEPKVSIGILLGSVYTYINYTLSPGNDNNKLLYIINLALASLILDALQDKFFFSNFLIYLTCALIAKNIKVQQSFLIKISILTQLAFFMLGNQIFHNTWLNFISINAFSFLYYAIINGSIAKQTVIQ